ncbi:hypothetical protein HBA55_34490 [Pseudomaricurvus alkylphenolicus]|uniref:hypothetical protein n=1 Tax=Pseudomaricurvus alkylphenolicus TaxID=1306991 RepID=UPI001422DC1B|nr:hypothetical protein [Pseudomaricurvus alkylphenolicus]NIB44740.1 hypothetical protein [Pseudomaricurvus alkylphenolicus]
MTQHQFLTDPTPFVVLHDAHVRDWMRHKAEQSYAKLERAARIAEMRAKIREAREAEIEANTWRFKNYLAWGVNQVNRLLDWISHDSNRDENQNRRGEKTSEVSRGSPDAGTGETSDQ